MIRRPMLALAAAVALSPALAHPVAALPANVTIGWSSELADSVSPDSVGVLGAPDARCTTVSDYHYLWVRRFGTLRSYDTAVLAAFLGVVAGDLVQADLLAFECNGGSPAPGGGWESSDWFVSDSQRSYAETFDERLARGTVASGRRAVFKTGSVTGTAFNHFFGVTTGNPVMSWILIRLPADINTQPTDPIRFSIWVSGAMRGEGSPDPDSIGVIRH